jgi:FolB domain-containing protein|tara:strand:- start:2479 stop:2892 length:414 start_codon:yes stop_codon:yes gene_type:complete
MKTKKRNNVIEIFEKPLISTLVRKILIKNLTINAIFGYYPKEKVKSQRLKFNIKLELTNKIKFNDTDLRSIVDYDNIIKTINNILDKKINFLETLGELVAEEILKNKKIDAIELQIEKLDILKKDASVGFEISKRKV